MSQILKRDFVEGRVTVLSNIPETWDVDTSKYYKLDLKMCQLRSVNYGFNWGSQSNLSDRFKTVIEMPNRVLSFDLSLNELSSLDHEALAPLNQLRHVDASLNKISSLPGIEMLQELRSLNLAHNAMFRVDLLPLCPSLESLNLGMNQLEDVSSFPHLKNLTVLHLNNNKLSSLDGLQTLGRLQELYAQCNNVTDLIPLSTCLHLVTFNVAHNKILTLNSVIEVLGRLKRLRILSLQGNPVERNPGYQTELLRNTNVVNLDGIMTKAPPQQRNVTPPALTDNMMTIKDLTKQAYEDQIRTERNRMEESVNFLQARILAIQNDFQDYEHKMRSDLDICLHHLEGLSSTQLAKFDSDHMRGLLRTPIQKPWQQEQNDSFNQPPERRSHDESKTDYKNVTDTDEVLRMAYLELSKGQGGQRFT